jgi:CheY-like chemotaxis protein
MRYDGRQPGGQVCHWTVASACNGSEALQLLDQLELDLIVLDIYMPVVGGRQTLGHSP